MEERASLVFVANPMHACRGACRAKWAKNSEQHSERGDIPSRQWFWTTTVPIQVADKTQQLCLLNLSLVQQILQQGCEVRVIHPEARHEQVTRLQRIQRFAFQPLSDQ